MAAASPSREATIVLDAEGRYLDASPPALELLGVDLPTLRASKPGSFRDPAAPPIDQSRREQLAAAVHSGLAGETTIRRADGSVFRAHFSIVAHPERPGLLLATIEPTSMTGADSVRTLPEILEAWRQADRELASLEPGTPEWQAAKERSDAARDAYQRLSRGTG